MWRVGLGLVAALAMSSAAAADMVVAPLDIAKEVSSRCGYTPIGSVIIAGATATKEEMELGKVQVQRFMKDIDLFQNCVIAVAVALKDKLTEANKVALQKIVEESQKEKESMGVEYNQAVDAYNTAHPAAKASTAPAKPAHHAAPPH